jgi:hypothetical protein
MFFDEFQPSSFLDQLSNPRKLLSRRKASLFGPPSRHSAERKRVVRFHLSFFSFHVSAFLFPANGQDWFMIYRHKESQKQMELQPQTLLFIFVYFCASSWL